MNLHRVRQFERIAVEVTIYVSTPTQGRSSETLKTQEVGEGGCLLVGADFFGVGRVLTLDLMMGTHPVRAIAKVLYEYRDLDGKVLSGVEFQYLPEEHLARLQSFLASRLLLERRATA